MWGRIDGHDLEVLEIAKREARNTLEANQVRQNWGSQRLIGIGKQVTLALVTLDDDKSYPFTVNIDIVPVITVPPSSGHSINALPLSVAGPCVATISFGSAGARSSVVVDVIKSFTLCVPGSFVQVDVSNESASHDFSVQASVTRMTLSTSIPPQRTLTLADALTVGGAPLGPPAVPGNAGVWNVPKYAKSCKIYRAPYTAPFTIRVIDEALVVRYEVIVAASTDCPTIPIANGIAGVAIIVGADQINEGRIIFELAI